MSKTDLKKRIFSEKEFEEADKLGKIEISILNPDHFTLNGKEEKYYQQMRKTFHILTECSSELEAHRLMKEIFITMRPNHIYKLIADTQKFFSAIIERNVQFDKIIQSNRILKHIQKAEKEKDYSAVARLEKLYMEIRGTDQNTQSVFNWSELTLPEIMETSDTTVLFEDAIVEDE